NSACTYDTTDAKSLIALDFANTGPCPHPTNFVTSPKWNRCLAKVNRSMGHSRDAYLAYLWNFDFTRILAFELMVVWKKILGFCFLSIVLSLMMSLLLRFLYSAVVYVIFAVAAIFTVGLPCCMWILFANRLRRHEDILNSKILHFFHEDMGLDPRS
uniref:Uncharacterized protein n=1 Tax=Panagrolaimus sp. JU765 TaxID=591449 RepID=A0AC34R1X2_9BILA